VGLRLRLRLLLGLRLRLGLSLGLRGRTHVGARLPWPPPRQLGSVNAKCAGQAARVQGGGRGMMVMDLTVRGIK
jgi:hypothetical protein